ncbi:sensor histidine kinase [Jeotgalibaca caeni]|uniref:sensor histidine kinase n=1 Tax=Jeotgalibaca caeni TaxID=3028623 RepID=UPI00237DA82C|nr:sensor histidine kinase [Jeotgalibaca caeni]MDE1548409.1 sensor histidine kinase [Jeotgalibaca caeni]
MRQKNFLKLFFTIFVVLSLVVATTIFSLRPTFSWSDLWSPENFRVPVLLFMGTVVFFLSLIFSWVIQYNLLKRERAMAENLHRLNVGNYTQPIEPDESNKPFFMGEDYANSYEEMENLRLKLIQLSREVQELSSVPRMVGNETKEQILEEERHRIARELHDSVSQQLFAAMMMLSALNEKKDTLPENIQKPLRLIESIVNESQSEMRALLLHLRPVKLEGKTLKKGIEQLLVELRTKVQMNLKWEISPIDTIPGIEDHLFRIAQELLSNTLRHAKAKNLEVYLQQNEQEINLRMFDDGVGFDTSVEKSGSYGLMNIRERVSGLGGTCKIISFPQQGTIVDIRIPNTMND